MLDLCCEKGKGEKGEASSYVEERKNNDKQTTALAKVSLDKALLGCSSVDSARFHLLKQGQIN